MTTDQVSLFLALLALAAQLAAAGLVVALMTRRLQPSARWPATALGAIGPVALALASPVAIVATLGSLYYSDVADYPFFVVVDGDGTVVQRTSGELSTAQLDDIASTLAEGER